MKRLVSLSLWIALCAVAAADAPRSTSLTRYSKLWTSSPFTSKPPPPDEIPEDNPLEDYALGGISKLADGYFAILFNKKKPDDKITITPGSQSDFEVVDVDWNRDNWKETVVTVRHGRNTGTVKFEEKLLTVKTSVPKKPQKPTSRGSGSPTPKPSSGKPSSGRAPRPRVVVPKK